MAEHILPDKVDNLLDTLANGRLVAMTHALPDQGGHHHVNCQPPEYWIERMATRGFKLTADNQIFRELAKDATWTYFERSGVVFLKY